MTYLAVLPYELQDMIWKYVNELKQKDVHIELKAELSNDIPRTEVLVYDNPTIYMKKLNEVMNILSEHKDSAQKCYKYLMWYLIKYYSTKHKVAFANPKAFDTRGKELVQHVNNMVQSIHRLTYHMQSIDTKNYTGLLEIKNRLTVLTYGELHGLKIHMVEIRL